MGSEVGRDETVDVNGHKVREIRRALKMTQADLAAGVQRSRGYMGMVEGTSNYRVSVTTAEGLAVTLKAKLEEIIASPDQPVNRSTPIASVPSSAGASFASPRQISRYTSPTSRLTTGLPSWLPDDPTTLTIGQRIDRVMNSLRLSDYQQHLVFEHLLGTIEFAVMLAREREPNTKGDDDD